MLPQNIDIHGIDTPSADEAVAFLTRPLPSDLSAMISHAADALDCVADTSRWHLNRAVSGRGLERFRSTRAVAGAAQRAEDFACDLRLWVADGREFTTADAPWLKFDFNKVTRSRRTVRHSAAQDFGRFGRNDRESPEFRQLQEIDNAPAMFAALSAVNFIAEAILLTLSGEYDPTRARVLVAEEMAALYANLREWGQ